jgi:F-type H+-transporting ATPase subunit b
VPDILAAAAEAAHGAEEHAEAAAFGISFLTPGFFVALAMIVVILIALRVGVPGIVAKVLDDRIAGIRKQLEEARALRAEAEKLRDDYARKTAEAEKDIVVLRASAEKQAEEIVEKAKADAAALIERHKVISAEKIATAERNAVEELRAKVASAAAAAARELIAEKHGEAADRKLADEIISNI